MKGMTVVLMSTLNMTLLISLCQGSRYSGGWRSSWWRSSRSNIIRMSTSGPSTEMTSQLFNCKQPLTVPIAYFELNVTLNSSAILENPNVAELTESASDKSWHYLTSLNSSFPVGDLHVQFTLIFNNTPNGNCSFVFQEDNGLSLTTIHPNITMMTSCDENMTSTTCGQPITTTSALVNNFDNTMNNTNFSSMNGSKCLCPCECAVPMSKERSDQMMAAILEDMRIPRVMTSFSKRKLSSATDNRISCTGIGLVGVFVLIVVFGVIIISDINLFLFNARTALIHIRGHYGF